MLLLLRPFRKCTVCVPNNSFLIQYSHICQNESLSSNYPKIVISAHLYKKIIKKHPGTSCKLPISLTIVNTFLEHQKLLLYYDQRVSYVPKKKIHVEIEKCVKKVQKNLEPPMCHKLTWHYFSHVGISCGNMGKIVADQFGHIC